MGILNIDDNRPFESPQKMDEVMIDRWNETVSDDDTVYILGDFSWYQESNFVRYEFKKNRKGRRRILQRCR